MDTSSSFSANRLICASAGGGGGERGVDPLGRRSAMLQRSTYPEDSDIKGTDPAQETNPTKANLSHTHPLKLGCR